MKHSLLNSNDPDLAVKSVIALAQKARENKVSPNANELKEVEIDGFLNEHGVFLDLMLEDVRRTARLPGRFLNDDCCRGYLADQLFSFDWGGRHPGWAVPSGRDPQEVLSESTDEAGSPEVRRWTTPCPDWIEVRVAPAPDAELLDLDSGETSQLPDARSSTAGRPRRHRRSDMGH